MACACSGKKGSAQKTVYTVKTPGGKTRSFSSESDAKTYAKVSGGKIV